MPSLTRSSRKASASRESFGDAIAGAQASRKIQHNMQILGSCERLIAEQEAIVQGLLKAVHAASQQAAASLQAAELTLHEEKQRIFDALRQRWGAPWATWTLTALPT